MTNPADVPETASAQDRVTAECKPITRIPAHQLSYDDFLSGFMHASRPVVVSGAGAHWPAVQKWSPAYFKALFGDRSVAVTREKRMPFDEFADAVEASCDEQPGPYMFRTFLHEALPELLPDVIPQNKFAFARRHASPLMPVKWRRPDGFLKLLMGGKGSKFPVMHFDGDNSHACITQIHGDKEFVMFAPQDAPYLYPGAFQNHSTVDDPIHQDRLRFPLLAQATPYRALLGPGDMICVPARWWHTARALSTSIAVCTTVLDSSNWQGFVSEVAGNRRKLPLRLRLELTGRVLGACEALQTHNPALARALVLPQWLAPISAAHAPEPSRRQLKVRIPTA